VVVLKHGIVSGTGQVVFRRLVLHFDASAIAIVRLAEPIIDLYELRQSKAKKIETALAATVRKESQRCRRSIFVFRCKVWVKRHCP
jgi:hypothetical protein